METTTAITIQDLPKELVNLQATFKTHIDSSDILQNFSKFFYEMAEIKKQYAGINFDSPTIEDSKMAGNIRKQIAKVRTASERVKDDLAKDYVTVHKMITASNTLLSTACKMDEEVLSKIEKHVEIQEANRLALIKAERLAMIAPFGFQSEDMPGIEKMPEVAFQSFLIGTKKQQDDKKAADLKIENERIAAENLRIENEAKLKAENERIKKESEAIKAKADAERKAEEEKAAILKRESDAKLAEAKKVSDKLAADLKAKADAERKAEEEKAAVEKKRIAYEKKAAKAPDKHKLLAVVESITMPAEISLKDKDAQIVYESILLKFAGFKIWSNAQIDTL
jgi:hypothetical protein